jgi:hypothetical protein
MICMIIIIKEAIPCASITKHTSAWADHIKIILKTGVLVLEAEEQVYVTVYSKAIIRYFCK